MSKRINVTKLVGWQYAIDWGIICLDQHVKRLQEFKIDVTYDLQKREELCELRDLLKQVTESGFLTGADQ